MATLNSLIPQALLQNSQEQTDNESQPYSSGLPSGLIRVAERIFEVMTVKYGAGIMASRYPTDELVKKAKQSMANSIRNMPMDNITYGMKHLPDGFPPSENELLSIMRRMPPPAYKGLEHKLSADDIAHNKDRIKAIKAQFGRFA